MLDAFRQGKCDNAASSREAHTLTELLVCLLKRRISSNFPTFSEPRCGGDGPHWAADSAFELIQGPLSSIFKDQHGSQSLICAFCVVPKG
jgi:hypothetical protein